MPSIAQTGDTYFPITKRFIDKSDKCVTYPDTTKVGQKDFIKELINFVKFHYKIQIKMKIMSKIRM